MAASGVSTDDIECDFDLETVNAESARIRYPSERPKAKAKARSSNKDNNASSTVNDTNKRDLNLYKVKFRTNFRGKYTFAISAVTDNEPSAPHPHPHPHRLVGDRCPNDLGVVIIPMEVESPEVTVEFRLVIEGVKKADAVKSLTDKCKLICPEVNFDPVVPSSCEDFDTSADAIKQFVDTKKSYTAGRVRLMFVAFLEKANKPACNETGDTDTKPKSAGDAVTAGSSVEFRQLVPEVDGVWYERVCERFSEVLTDKDHKLTLWSPQHCSVFGGDKMAFVFSKSVRSKADIAKKNYKVQFCTDDSFDKSDKSIWFAEAEVTNKLAQIFECTIPPYTGPLELGAIPAHESKTARSDQGTSTVNVNEFNCKDIEVHVRLCAFTKTSGAANSENEPEVISDGNVFKYTAAPVTHQLKHKQAQPSQFTPAQSQPNQSAASNAAKANIRDRLAQRMNNPNLPPDSNPNQTQNRPVKLAARKGDRSGGGGAAISVTPSVGAGAATTAMQPQTRPTVNPVIRFASPGPPTGVITAARGPTIYHVSPNQQLSANFPQPGTSASASACASVSGSGLSVEARMADTEGLGAYMYYTAQPVGSGNSAGVGVGTFGQAAPQQGSSQPNLLGFLESSMDPLLVSHDNSYSGSQTSEAAFVADGNQSYVGTLNSDGVMFNPVSSEINQQEDFGGIASGLVQSVQLQAADDSTAPAPAPAPNASSNSIDYYFSAEFYWRIFSDQPLQGNNLDQFLEGNYLFQLLQELNSSENQQHLENFPFDYFDDI